EYELEGSVTRANVYKNTAFETVDCEYYLTQCESNLYASQLNFLPLNVKSYMQREQISNQTHQTEAAVQDWFNKLMTQFSSRWDKITAKDTHDVGYLNGLMPDISIFKTEDVVEGAYIPLVVQTILELKVQKRHTGFFNEEKGQLIDYIRILVRQQPLRKLFAIFLSDGSYFYVMSFNRHTKEYQEYLTNLTEGLRLFYTLILRKSDFVRAIGVRSITFNFKHSHTRSRSINIRLEEFLGQGSSADVYRIKWNNRPAVIKIITDPDDSVTEREVGILKLLKNSNVQNIPEYVTHDSEKIIMYPVCKRINKKLFQAKHVRELLQILEKIHSIPIYHRDVRPSNIMLDTSTDSLILVDWGSAVHNPISEVTYEGTSTYASNNILNNDMGPYTPQPTDDLHSFVRTMYILINPLRQPKDLKSSVKIKDYWDHELNDRPLWKEMLTAADENNIE
ncbi:4655_t:CDS:2, partial [Funneliformis mosseae]